MLHFLKRDLKKKVQSDALGKFNLQAIPIALPLPFNPFDLPILQAGYLMNTTVDMPQGSINPSYVSGEWFEDTILKNTSLLLRRTSQTVTVLNNGFKCESISTETKINNPTIDLLNGQTNCSFMCAFKTTKNLAASYKILNMITDATESIFVLLGIKDVTGQLFLYESQYPNFIQKYSINDYGNNVFHVAIVNVNQDAKLIEVYTDLGEHISGSNAAFLIKPFTSIDGLEFCLGARSSGGINAAAYPALFGDYFFFNDLLTIGEINALMAYESHRLGITYVSF